MDILMNRCHARAVFRWRVNSLVSTGSSPCIVQMVRPHLQFDLGNRFDHSTYMYGILWLTSLRPRLLVAKGIASRSKDATRGSWPYY